MKKRILDLCVLLTLMTTTTLFAAEGWKATLKKELPLLGDRNWIAVVDSAYPLQTSPGIETVSTKANQLTVVKGVLTELKQTRHVRPVIYIDAEQKFVAETKAPGISAYRKALEKILADQPVQDLPHEQIIGRLNDAGKTFKILIIKTPLTLPYTSVYFHLKCGYWSDQAEQQLREVMKEAPINAKP
jgi:hypothetical protein